jgi:hypothetical protein
MAFQKNGTPQTIESASLGEPVPREENAMSARSLWDLWALWLGILLILMGILHFWLHVDELAARECRALTQTHPFANSKDSASQLNPSK